MGDETETWATEAVEQRFVQELGVLRQRVAELEASEARRKRVEEALRESEGRLRSLFETMDEGMVLIAPDGQIVQANPAAEHILGLGRSDIESRSYVAPEWEILRYDGTSMPPEEMAGPRAMKEKCPVKDVVMGVKRPDGYISWISVGATPLMNDTGELEGVVGIFSDITGHKRAEEMLRESEQKFRSVYSQSPIAIELYDFEGHLIDVNPACLDLFGVADVEAVKGFRLFEDPNVPEAARQRLLAGEAVKFEAEFDFDLVKELGLYETSKSGRCYMDCLITPWMMIEGDAPSGFLVHARDITERKRAEEALRESEDCFRTLVEGSVEGILVHRDTKPLFVNPAYARILGYGSPDEILSVDSVVSLIAPYDRERMLDYHAARVKGEPAPAQYEYDAVCKDGSIVTLQLLVTTIPWDGDPAVLATIIDVTERRQAEEALRESNRCLEETLAELRATQEKIVQQERLGAVGQLAAGIAHEFNNILASITLYTQMSLCKTGLSPGVRESLEIIARRVEHATDLVQQILDFGRRAMLKREPLDVALLLEGTVGLLKRTLPENIEIDLARGVDAYTISADPERVQQAIVNLALNARDAMPEGGALRIGLSRLRIVEGQETPLPGMEVGEWVQVTVTDTGTGIPPDVLPHIYEPFFTTRAPLGHGLGLAQVYGIVKQHEGHIGVETQIRTDCGQSGGTTFTVYWPALPVAASQPDAPVRKATGLVQGNGEVILVVEDNHAMRTALIDCLEMLNYRVLEAANGQEALTVFEEHQGEIALVLSDWVMPGVGGLELARALKQRRRDIKVLILTGYLLDQEIKDTAPEGIVGWVKKPAQLEQLAEAVAQALGAD
jgi:PAS domain S-box-containing protein